MRIVVFAPNWLGDAVMAIPAVARLRHAHAAAVLAVAARPHLAPLYEMVEGVDDVVSLHAPSARTGWRAAWADARRLRTARHDVAVLLPNSFRSAATARLAGIRERWGYATDARSWLLTRAVPRVQGGHQVDYYRALVDRLALGEGAMSGVRPSTGTRRDVGALQGEPEGPGPGLTQIRLVILAGARERARALLAEGGWKPGDPLVGMAPGAAYGTAKQWLPERFAQLAGELAEAGVRAVLVGSAGDRTVCNRVPAAMNLAGRTDLRELAAVIAECHSFVTNDSGAMHVAAAVGTPVTAIFGPTREWETGPVPIDGRHAIVLSDVPCRPCMLRECPIEHQCMTAIGVDRVKAEVMKQLARR